MKAWISSPKVWKLALLHSLMPASIGLDSDLVVVDKLHSTLHTIFVPLCTLGWEERISLWGRLICAAAGKN